MATRKPKSDPVKTEHGVDYSPELPLLSAHIREHEDRAMAMNLVVTAIVHPFASPGIHDGRYAGIRIFEGDLSATYSDGSKH